MTSDQEPQAAQPKIDTGGAAAPVGDTAGIVARAESLEDGGTYEMPPGDPVTHYGAGFAKILASNVFLTGLDPDFVARNVGGFTAPLDLRHHVVSYDVDRSRQEVRVELDNGVTRVARIVGSQGAVTIPLDEDDVHFTPSVVTSTLPPADEVPWPLGDAEPTSAAQASDAPDAASVADVIDRAFAPDALTAAVVVTHRDRVIGERYGADVGPSTPLESWSMGKSLTATLLARLIHDGVYDLDQPAPIPEWSQAGDPRQAIRIRDILNMSSGLRFRAMQDPGYDPGLGYPDHLYVYTGGINAFGHAASRPRQWPPGQVGRYRNGDPVLANYLVRLGVEGRGEDYHSFPQRELFDRIGIRTATLETDPFGNFLLQGYEFLSARDWARLANLYLRDGVAPDGERLLPEGWVDFVSTLAPGWAADGRPIYGGFFWLNGDGAMPIPTEAYFMAGAGGQKTIIIPSHDLVVVRLGHYRGNDPGTAALNDMLSGLMELF